MVGTLVQSQKIGFCRFIILIYLHASHTQSANLPWDPPGDSPGDPPGDPTRGDPQINKEDALDFSEMCAFLLRGTVVASEKFSWVQKCSFYRYFRCIYIYELVFA